MILLRSLLFNIAFYLFTALMALVGLPMLLAPRRSAARFGRAWAAGVLKLLGWCAGLTHEVLGAANLPPGPAIIAMKHQSAWDTLAVPVVFADPAIVLKRELMLIPFYGWYLWKAGMIAIDRGAGASALKRMVASGEAVAADGRAIVIFPEGTRTAPGAQQPYQPGVAALYRQLGLPLVPVAVNSGVFWGRRHFAKRPGRITIEILRAIPPGGERRAVMAELESRIEAATARLVALGRAAPGR
ncbi:MAG TPA: lysophospholipid acyltransferase family protein [Stellaceae bacterium]|nr:lysophospholipid acyltransferase family protein [Stellaceae bacterium]